MKTYHFQGLFFIVISFSVHEDNAFVNLNSQNVSHFAHEVKPLHQQILRAMWRYV